MGNFSIKHITTRIVCLGCLFLLAVNVQAQRLELRFNKEFSNNAITNKSLGAGGSFIIDGWADRLDFQLNFDYAGYKAEADNNGISTKYRKLKGGISALYVLPVGKMCFFRVGGDISYNNLQKVDSWNDTVVNVDNGNSFVNRTHYGHSLGIGAIADFQVKLGNYVRIGAGIIPSYLIPLAAKTTSPSVESDYKKGLFIMQLQIGLEIKLYNN